MAKIKHRLDVLWQKLVKQKQKEFDKLKKRYVELTAEAVRLKDEIAELDRVGVEFGTPSWKTQVTTHAGDRKEYLRLLYPNGGNKYIGCKEDKVAKALADIERGKKQKSLVATHIGCVNEMEEIISAVESLLENSSYY